MYIELEGNISIICFCFVFHYLNLVKAVTKNTIIFIHLESINKYISIVVN